jgi:hypothetical protein
VRVTFNGRADRASRAGHLRPALSINALLATLYLGVRLAAYVGVAAKQYPDSQSYLDVAKARFLGGEFFAGARPWTLPLLYKILPDSDTYRSAGQFVVSVVCWLALAAVTARCVQDQRLRPIAFGVVLLFSLSSSITRWDHLILTESLAVSLTAAVLAAWLAFIRRPTGLSVAAVLLVSLLWAFVRDTNTVLVIFTALFALVAVGFRGLKGYRLVVLVGLIAIAAASVASTTTDAAKLRRNERPILGAVGLRVLADPDMTAYFRAHGMPAPTPRVRAHTAQLKGLGNGLPTDPDTEVFLDWARNHARATLTRYLVTHPDAATLPLFTKAGQLADAVPGYQPPGAHSILPPILRDVVFPSSASVAFAVAGTVLLVTVAMARRSGPQLLWAVPVLALLALVPYASVTWYGDAFDVSRHALLVTIVLRLCPLLLAVFLIDSRLARAAPPSGQADTSVDDPGRETLVLSRSRLA